MAANYHSSFCFAASHAFEMQEQCPQVALKYDLTHTNDRPNARLKVCLDLFYREKKKKDHLD